MTKKLRRGPTRGVSRGFTLVELLAAIMIIALLAALATPSFVAMIRDRRVVRSGLYLIDTYREARMHALAAGRPVLVRWRGDGAGKGVVSVREVPPSTTSPGALKTCSTSDWGDAATETTQLNRYDFAGTTYELADIHLFSDTGTESVIGDVCFAPDGRTYIRYADSGTMNQLNGVIRYDITNSRTGFKRVVFVPPNGIARYQL